MDVQLVWFTKGTIACTPPPTVHGWHLRRPLLMSQEPVGNIDKTPSAYFLPTEEAGTGITRIIQVHGNSFH